MKPEIAHRDSGPQWDTEGLDRAIKIPVIDRVLIMPNARDRARHFEGNERTAIDSRLRLDRIDGRSRPNIDGRDHSDRGSRVRKGKACHAADKELFVGRIVAHVALRWMSLAPGVLMRSDVLRFGIIRRAGIQRRVQVASLHKNPVRCPAVSVVGVVSCSRGEGAGKGIHPGARTQVILSRI